MAKRKTVDCQWQTTTWIHTLYTLNPNRLLDRNCLDLLLPTRFLTSLVFLLKKQLARLYKRKILLHLINKEPSAELSMHQINSYNG